MTTLHDSFCLFLMQFTIAVNTGPLDGQVLLDAGADLLLPSIQALSDHWDTLFEKNT